MADNPPFPLPAPGDTYDTHATGIRILPGQWRPHYPWEQIAWVSPPWPSQDYIWLDFPEAIFTDQGLQFLSHVNPPIATLFHDLPPSSWTDVPGGIAFKRELPNRVSFSGSVIQGGSSHVNLELAIHNGSDAALTSIVLQTCAFLRGIKEFADFTRENKFVHSPGRGWLTFDEALAVEETNGAYRLGWRRSGPLKTDLPVMAVRSNMAERLIAMTWFEDTLSLVQNPGHPCMHADPHFPDLNPGESAAIRGAYIFFEGSLEDFDYTQYRPKPM